MRGDRLQAARERAGLTRQGLAEMIGASSTAVESWERGRRNPKVEVLPELATLLSVTVDYLVGTDDLSQDIASARRTIELAAGRDPLEELMTVWQAIKHRPDMQNFILELAQEDPETIQRVLIVSIQSHTSHVSLQHGHQMDTGLKLGKRKSPGLAGAVSNISLLSREANACLPQRQLFFCSLALRCAHRTHAFLHAFRPRQETAAAAAPTAPSHVPVPGI